MDNREGRGGEGRGGEVGGREEGNHNLAFRLKS